MNVAMSWSVSRDRRLDLAPPRALVGIEMAQRGFQPVAQPVERRAQIVRDGIGHLAHALHQPLDAVEHAVEIFGQRVELVMRAR